MIPAVPTFSVDEGFWYSATEDTGLGSMVRVPLGGRRVRGYVVELSDRPPRSNLRSLGPKVMNPPVFDRGLLDALIWAAYRYVAPVAVLLDRATPPNLANRLPTPPPQPKPIAAEHALTEYSAAVASGRRRPPVAFIARSGDAGWVAGAAGPALEAGCSVLIVAATGAEVEGLATIARRHFADQAVVVTPETSAAETTTAWIRSQASGHLLIGTPRVAAWPIAGLAVAVAVEEGRRAMKERQTPTISVRDFLRTRSSLSASGLVFVGPTPSLETIASGPTVIRSRPRAWPPVEIVDRNREPDMPGLLGVTAQAAIRAVTGRAGRVFVFAHRRGYAPAARCQRCRTLRRCPNCGARPETAPNCPRCDAVLGPCASCGHTTFIPLGAGVGRVLEELGRRYGPIAAAAPAAAQIQVGSEADLAELGFVDLTVAVDADGLVFGTNYRSAEEALRILARLAGRVAGRSSRALVQTSMPDHPVMRALMAGDPLPFAHDEIETRRRLQFPPASQLLVVELRGPIPLEADRHLQALGSTVMGPAIRQGKHRWLLQGTDLGPTRKGLRPLVQRWRDGGTTVRIDSDPLDL